MRDTIGCTEHKWLHHDHEYLVDECVCDTELCNKDMQPIPSSTTSKSTTPSGKVHHKVIHHRQAQFTLLGKMCYNTNNYQYMLCLGLNQSIT